MEAVLGSGAGPLAVGRTGAGSGSPGHGGGVGANRGERGVEGRFERGSVASGLGEEQPALNGCQQGEGEQVDVGVGAQ